MMLGGLRRTGSKGFRQVVARAFASEGTLELNWSLNADGVTPSGETFRNVVPSTEGKLSSKAPANVELDLQL